MLPLRDNQLNRQVPVLTYTLVALNAIIFLWDRHFNVMLSSGFVFSDLAVRSNEVTNVFAGGDRFALVTLLTSMFLHGSLFHLVGNMLFLLTFGESVEAALGSWRFTLYYLFWGLIAAAAQIFVNPLSPTPTMGASGAIGGVLGCYFLLFPANKIEVLVFITTWVVDAWKLLGIWFLYQIFIPQEGVANWAHAGGFMAGMATVLIMGGRKKILHGRERELIEHFD